jgi:large subunit ribosomal protein L21
VTEGDRVSVELLPGQVGDTITLDQVLMVGEGDQVQVGTPLVSGAAVTAEVTEQTKGPKIIVFKKRRRKNYRRKNGHRQLLTKLKITGIQK